MERVQRSWWRNDGRVKVNVSLKLRMKTVVIVMVTLCLHHTCFSPAQGCPSHRDLVTSLQQLEQMLAAHEASHRQSLRSMRKKISVLSSSTFRSNASCPKPAPPANGRRLGRVFAPGHQVHFLCRSGYELIGPQSRVCLSTLAWSGRTPSCRRLNSTSSSLPPPDSSSSSPPPSAPSTRPSHCTHLGGSTRCTCPVGFAISSRNDVCTDIDECRVFPLGRPGRLCVHRCANTPGSFRCFCPAGYDLAGDGSGCTDVDECERQTHNCPAERVCVNTFGGFQCVAVACPRRRNATYIKTSPVRCEKNPCVLGDKGCFQAPNSISFHFLSLVSNMSAPRDLFRVSAARVLGDTLRFGLAGGHGRGHFSMQRSGRQSGTLVLVAPLRGPTTLEAEVEMSELEGSSLLGRYVTRVTLFVSAFDF